MSAVWRAWWRGAVLVASANFAVAAAIALVAALLGLMVEDLLPVGAVERELSGARTSALAAALVVLFATLLLRAWVHRHTGTLFYVRIIDSAMPDLHGKAVEHARRRRMAMRSVTRWVDLSGRTTPGGVIDVAADCEQMASTLEAVVNTDRDDTAYTLAPNMLWPLALAVGAELPIVDKLRLLELMPAARELLFELPSSPVAANGTVIEVQRSEPETPPEGGRVGLLLAFGPAAKHMLPAEVFAGFGVAEWHRLRPAWVDPSHDLTTFTTRQLSLLAASLPSAVASIKREAGDRELVVAAAMPKALAMALGWGLAQLEHKFFTGTYLLHYDRPSGTYRHMCVHPSQPTRTVDVGVG